MWPMKMENYRYSNTFVNLFALSNAVLLGLFHALGHKRAKYGIPHGITSCVITV